MSSTDTSPTPASSSSITAPFESNGEVKPVIDPEKVLEQCGDWGFVVELLEDVIREKDSVLTGLIEAYEANDHTKFHKQAHALKGAALNLHLIALTDVSKRTEALGKKLETDPKNEELLDLRLTLINEMQGEYERLEAYMPEAQELAAAGDGEIQE